MDELRIVKGGRLMFDEWDSKTKEFNTIDVTDQALFFLDRECGLEPGIRLWDVFWFVKNMNKYELLSPILTHSPDWLEQLVEEGLYPKESFVNQVILGWEGSINEYGETPELSVWQHLYGIKDNIDDRWGFSFSPCSDFTDTPIVLNPRLVLYDERKESNKNRTSEEIAESYHAILTQVDKVFTLYDILYGIFYELSFHGGPYERDKAGEEIRQISQDIDEGKVEGIPFENVKALMKDLDDDE